MTRPLVSLFSVLLLLCSSSFAAKCPKETEGGTQAGERQTRSSITVINRSPLPVKIYWVDTNGKTSESTWGPVVSGDSERISTYVGHKFRIYGTTSSDERLLLLEHTVTTEQKERVEVLGDCDEVDALVQAQREATDKEMRSLVHDQEAPCLPEHNSSQWSCVKHISKDAYEERLNKHRGTIYGFNSTEESGTRNVGDVVDTVHVSDIPKIPRVSNSKGFLKMEFTDKMKQVLLPFFEEHKRGGPKDSEETHRDIPGGFTNSHTISMSIIYLDRFPKVHAAVSGEIHRILEWWTNQTLVPTATFGIRNYHRGSMLINHADRADTHVASAVIQVAQEGVDEGWPLEVISEDGSCYEVYLQPGELVLYEGARFLHGRPMRFNGTSFANIFSHFRPVDWHGPGKSPAYDGKLDERGYLIGSRMEQGTSDEL